MNYGVCLAFSIGQFYYGNWFDGPCDEEKSFLCEKPLNAEDMADVRGKGKVHLQMSVMSTPVYFHKKMFCVSSNKYSVNQYISIKWCAVLSFNEYSKYIPVHFYKFMMKR